MPDFMYRRRPALQRSLQYELQSQVSSSKLIIPVGIAQKPATIGDVSLKTGDRVFLDLATASSDVRIIILVMQ